MPAPTMSPSKCSAWIAVALLAFQVAQEAAKAVQEWRRTCKTW